MKSSLLLAVICIGGLTACQTAADVNAPVFKQGPSTRPNLSVTPTTVHLSPEERRLIGELAAMYPDDKAAVIRLAFEDPFMIGSKAPRNSRAQAIIDRIDVIRRLRADSIATSAQLLMSKQRTVVSATVVLLATLPDSASAVVWRRTHVVPHDVIALRADNATVGTLGAGLRMLMKLRRADGDSATADEHFAVYGENIPARWRGDLGAVAKSDLDKLRQSEAVSIPPFGNVRSRTVWLTGSRGASEKP